MARKSRVHGEWGQRPENAFAVPMSRYYRVVREVHGQRYSFGVSAIDFVPLGLKVGYIWVDKNDEWVLLSLSERKRIKRIPGLIDNVLSEISALHSIESEEKQEFNDMIDNGMCT